MRTLAAMPALGEVAQINPLMDARLPAHERISFVPMAAVSAEKACVESTIERPYAEVSKGYTAFQSGDVLFAKITPCFENGKIAQALLPQQHGFGSTEFHVIRPLPGVSDGRYLHHFLRLDRVRIEGQRRMTGSGGQRRVPANYLSELKIPLPPLPEQRRIAAILDQAETLRTHRRAALAQLDTLTQSLFLDMFGDPVTNPKCWPLSSMGEISDVQGGLQVTTARKDLPLEVPYLRVANVYRGYLDLSEIKRIRATAAEVTRTALLKDDLLVVEGHGNPNEIGRAALWNGVVSECVHQNHLIRARFNQRMVVPTFVAEYVNSPGGRRHLLRAGKSTSGLNTISVSNVRGTPVALPPLPLQQAFATRVQAIESLKAKHRAALAELDALFASLQHRAFNGELTAQASAQPKRRTFAELGQFDASKGLEALVYAARRLPNQGHYWPLKAQYVADRHHLERHGRTLYGETHVAMPYGPVPQAAFNASRALANGELICEFPMDAVRAALRRDGETLVALRDADPGVLGADERESLDWAIRLVADLSFEELKIQTHDAAWEKTPRNEPMAWQDIIATLDPAALQRLRATFE